MGSSDVNINLLVDAHKQYRGKLASSLQRAMAKSISEWYSDAAADSNLKIENLLQEVHEWPEEIKQEETESLLKECPWMMKAVKAIFVANAMILSSVDTGDGGGQMDIQIKMPSKFDVVHNLYKVAAESLAGIDQKKPSFVFLKGICKDAVMDTLDELFPIDEILGEQLQHLNDGEAFSAHNDNDGDSDIENNENNEGDAKAKEDKQQKQKGDAETSEDRVEYSSSSSDDNAKDDDPKPRKKKEKKEDPTPRATETELENESSDGSVISDSSDEEPVRNVKLRGGRKYWG